MPIDFEKLKIREPLDLGDYNEQLRGQTLEVWVNLSYKVRREIFGEKRPDEDKFKKLLCDIWDLTADEVDSFFERVDPKLFNWVLTRTWEMIAAYGEDRKKAEKA